MTGVVVLLFGGASYVVEYARLHEDARARLEGRLTTAKTLLANQLSLYAKETAGLAASTFASNGLVDSAGRSTYLTPLLERHILVLEYGFSLTLCDFLGAPISAGGPQGGVGCRLIGEPDRFLEARRPLAAIANRGSSPRLVLAYPVTYPGTNSAEGFVAGEMDIGGWLANAGVPVSADVGFFLSDRNGLVGSVQGAQGIGSRALAIRQPLELPAPLNDLDLSIEVRIDTRALESGLRWLLVAYAISGLAATLLAAGLALWIGKRIARPLVRLTGATKSLTTDLNAQVELAVEGTDEIAKLITAFSDMATRLRQSQHELEHRVAERTAELSMSLARFRAVLEASLDCVIVSDEHGRLVEFNPAAERTFGYRRDDVLGKSMAELIIPPAARAAHSAGLQRYCSTGQGRILGKRIEVDAQRSDGSEFPVELTIVATPSPTGQMFTGYLRDLTERKRAEAEIARHVERLSAIFALSPDGFVAFDARGRLTECNPAFERMAGLAVESLLGIRLEEFDARLKALCDPNFAYVDVHDASPDHTGSLSSASLHSRETLKLISPALRYLQRRVRRGEGDRPGLVIYFRDVTAETEVDRMKTEFLSTAAHELRTPMASIYGFTELMLKREFDTATRRDLVETVNRQAKILTNLVNELLDLARIEARGGKDFRFRAQPLRPVIESTLRSLIVPDDARKVELQLPDDLPDVAIDADKVQQALLNVVSNAYKYSPDGGMIVVGSALRVHDGRSQVGITVTDHGIGMTPEQSARAFERFYRADASGSIPGTGLGLALVKEIVEIHGGQVELRSALGKGTAVTLWLPTAAASEPPGPNAARAAALDS
ncbi:MAG: PAS domain S-box protein [Betaproteobacteria bacterium]|nr:PAS domain S-box protein [Betaproteobacteria bacterium]